MYELNETLKHALATARSNPLEALHLLETGLKKARKSGDLRGISILARHAGVVSTERGDFLGALKYYEEGLSADPRDAYLHFARGNVDMTLGQNERAHSAFTQSLVLATEEGDVDMIKMAREARARLATKQTDVEET